MTPRRRTLLAVSLFIPMAAVLLTTLACLPAPVGNPDTAKLDATLIGAWQATPKDADDKGQIIATLRALDAHTYFVQYLYFETQDGKEEAHVLDYKGWLAEIGGATFICCEALDDTQFLGGNDPDRYWWTAKLDRKGDTITVTPVDEDSAFIKDLKADSQKELSAKIEAAIKDHLNDKALYKDAMTFKKLDKDHLDVVTALRQKAKVGLDMHPKPNTIQIAPTQPATSKGMP